MQNFDGLSDSELVRRAVVEHMKLASNELPGDESSVERMQNQRKYVVLRKDFKVLAVYRVDPEGLKRQDVGQRFRDYPFA